MWTMYASLDTGVRICLPTMSFKWHTYTDEEYAAVTETPVDHMSPRGTEHKSFMPAEDLAKGLFSVAYLEGSEVLNQVQYTSDIDLLEPPIVSRGAGKISVATGKLGHYKNEYWAFQREWRYMMTIVPFNMFKALQTNSVLAFDVMANKLALDTLAPPCSYYDLHIDEEKLKQIEIVPSPKMSAGNRELLIALLEKHGLQSAPRPSALEGLL